MYVYYGFIHWYYAIETFQTLFLVCSILFMEQLFFTSGFQIYIVTGVEECRVLPGLRRFVQPDLMLDKCRI